MPVKLSKATQETSVGEGLALGCIALGVSSVMGSKMDVESGFRHAWSNWSYRSLFPTIRGRHEERWTDLTGVPD